MNHLTFETLIDYIHGELEPAEDALAHAHVAACGACRLELERETSLTARLRSAAAAQEWELPQSVKAGVRHALRQARPSPLRFLRPAFALPVAAAVALGVFLGRPLLHTEHGSQATITASFYLDEHAAQQARDPLSEHNVAPQSNETTVYTNASLTDSFDVVE